jgi:hypothetical protein
LQGEEAVELFFMRKQSFLTCLSFQVIQNSKPRGLIVIGILYHQGSEDVLNKQYAFELSTMYFIADIDKCARICGHLLSFLFPLFQSLVAFSFSLCFHSLSF